MRIAYLTGRYPATSHTFIHREIDALRARGADVHTFSIWRTDDAELLTPADREEAERTWPVLPLRPLNTVRAHLRALRAGPAAYAAAVAQAVALGRPGLRGRLLGLSWLLEAVVLWDQMRRRGVRHLHVHLGGTAPAVALVLTEFANAVEPGPERWTWSMTVHGPSEFYDVYGERLADKVRAASLVVCISDFARSQLMALVDERHWDKLRVVHCGVDPDVFQARRNGRGGPLHIVSVARLTQVKGQGVLLQALRELRDRGVDAQVTIVGDGPKRAELEELARDLGVADRATFAGAVGQDRIREHYGAADVFCLSSFAEGVPVVLMEAMAMELPVVAPDVMGVRELVEHEVSGMIVRPSRPDLVADTLARLAADGELRRRLGAAGRETVRREFDIRRSGEQLHGLFGAMLEPGAG